MSTTYTASAGLGKPALNDTGWNVPVNANADLLDSLSPVGGLCVSLHETPSASLNVAVAPGTFRKSDGTFVAYAGSASQALTPSATNYLYLTDAGVLTLNTSGFPASLHVRLAVAVAGSSTVTTLTDARVAFHSTGVTVSLALAGGTFADGSGVVTIGTGATNGVKLGATTGDKLGFWGVTPVTQPAGANQAAITDSTGGTASFTLATISDSATANAVASLARQLAAVRTALVAAGVIKGSA